MSEQETIILEREKRGRFRSYGVSHKTFSLLRVTKKHVVLHDPLSTSPLDVTYNLESGERVGGGYGDWLIPEDTLVELRKRARR